MKTIACKLGSDYCEQLFWQSLEIIVEINFPEILIEKTKDDENV